YHHVTKAVTITIANIPPTFTAAIPNQYDNAGAAIAGLTVTATDGDSHFPIAFTVTGLPAGLDYCHVDASGTCPAVTPDPHKPVASNLNPAAQAVRIFGTPTTPVTDAPVTVIITDAALGATRTSFTWTVIVNHPPVCSSATVVPQALWPPNHKLVTFSIGGVTD